MNRLIVYLFALTVLYLLLFHTVGGIAFLIGFALARLHVSLEG